MIVQTIKVDEITYNKILDTAYNLEDVTSERFTQLLNKGRRGLDKKTYIRDVETSSFICRKLDLYDIVATVKEIDKKNDCWKDICITVDRGQSEVISSLSDIYERPYAKECNAYMYKLLSSVYTDKEIEECYKSHEFIPSSSDDKEIHCWIPVEYKYNIIYKVDNCVKYDINSAYLYMLTKVFPKAEKALKCIRTRINKFKKSNKKNEAQRLKDIVNFFVGDMVNHNHKYTRAWIVKNIRELMDKTIDAIGGELLYANTDGFIVHNPKKVLNCTSKELGEFKSELYNGIGSVYMYLNKSTTGRNYQMYQYRDTNNEISTVGTLSLCMRSLIDLEQGIVVNYEEIRNGKTREYNLKEIKHAEIQNC